MSASNRKSLSIRQGALAAPMPPAVRGLSALARLSRKLRDQLRMTRSRTSDVAKGTQIKLAEARKGHRVAVLDVQGESCEIRRLGELGVFPGACLEIVSVSRGGRVVLRLGSSKLALDASVGERVLVTPV